MVFGAMAGRPHLQHISTYQTQSMLVVDGQELGFIDGLVLAGYYEVGTGHLLFVTDDCPYEEGLHIHLFD